MTTIKTGKVWAKYKNRESIIEIFEENNILWARELWPKEELRDHASKLEDTGYEILDREVFWTEEDPT